MNEEEKRLREYINTFLDPNQILEDWTFDMPNTFTINLYFTTNTQVRIMYATTVQNYIPGMAERAVSHFRLPQALRDTPIGKLL